MKKIEGFEGYYVTESGEIWSDKSGELKQRSTRLSSKGYVVINLSQPGAGQAGVYCLVHRLVADAYIPNPDNLPCVLHKDDDPGNPHKDNLFRGTHADNMRDLANKGYSNIAKGAKHCKSKKVLIQKENVLYYFTSIREAAELLGLHYGSLRMAGNRNKPYKGYKLYKEAGMKQLFKYMGQTVGILVHGEKYEGEVVHADETRVVKAVKLNTPNGEVTVQNAGLKDLKPVQEG